MVTLLPKGVRRRRSRWSLSLETSPTSKSQLVSSDGSSSVVDCNGIDTRVVPSLTMLQRPKKEGREGEKGKKGVLRGA